MKKELLDLNKRIKSELSSVEQTTERILDAWAGVDRFPDQQSYYVDSVALNLHSFYSGLERIFVIIARQLDQVFPSGERWHRDLLEQMAEERLEERPAVLSVRTLDLLDDFLAFRHLIRSLYAFELDVERLRYLIDQLPEAFFCIKQDLGSFCELLSIAADSNDTAQDTH